VHEDVKEKALGGAEFGRLLAGFRFNRELSQEELARRSGMSVRAIRDLERGQVDHPRRTTVALLADALRLNETDREAFEKAASGAVGRAEEPPGAPRSPDRAVPRQLPPDIADFTGRELALEWLHARMRPREDGSTAMVITAAVGKPGVGKTTLAVHAAHQLGSQFPDGQLYVNLRGAEAQALDPPEVLGRFLRALGVEGPSIPDDVDERADLYRSLMADRRALVVLDNAADEAQVRPLLPGGAGNAVLVTSRTRLTGLAGAEAIDLDVFPPEQAVELLGKISGAHRVAREPAAAQVIAALCGYLPLALRIAGAKLAAKPHWQLQRLAHRLGEQHRRLDELTAGDLEVRASVGLSYYGLGEVEQRAFRLLGLLEVPDFAAWMLAALLDIPAPEAEEVADHLADAQLLEPIGDDATGQLRYRFHDLVRLYARERLAAEDTLGTRRAALERTLQTYFKRAQEAVSQLRLRPPELPGTTAPAPPRDAQGRLAKAYQWLAIEHTGLAVSLDQAWREGLGGLGQALTRLLADFFEVYACRDEWEQTHQMALRAARRGGDRHAEASLLRGLGDLRRFQDRLPEAVELFTNSNAIFRELNDTGGEVDSLTGLARTYRRQHRLAEAASCFEECLRLCGGLDDPDREAKAMLFFAKVRNQQGQFDDALGLLTSSRELFRSVGSGGYVAYTGLMIGIMYSERGEFNRAAEYLEQALTFAQSLGDPRWEAYGLLNIAVAAQGRGSQDEARRALARSLALFQQAGDRQGTRQARQLIAGLDQAASHRA
jgi:tetratricopeptide (TPR) repeat protein/transcriptional regulator with XRE-family HTH domain